MFNFNALLARLKYIPRWSLMRQNTAEDLAQHTADVALTAHTLCLVANSKFGRNVNCEKVAVAALYHDVSEILTGDMPTPVKYNNPQIMSAYKAIESHAVNKLLETSDPAIRENLRPYMTQESLTEYEMKLLKAADKICALTKCMEEMQSGNKEFESAYKTTYQSLVCMDMEEVTYFMENMLGSYKLCLDELAKI